MKIVEIYKTILNYLGLQADDNGNINTDLDGKKEPVIVNGSRLVLPTEQQLRSSGGKDVMIFHPLMENILQSESPVIDKIKKVINIKLNYTIGIITQSLLNLVASPELHSKLSPEQAELLVKIKEADEKTVMNFINIMLHGIKTKSDSLFVSIYLRRGGVFKNKKHSRVGIVMFPFYKDLIDNKVEKIRVKDTQTYKDIMEFIFPDINESEFYNYGSNSNVAPYIDAILMTSANIASRLNDIINLYSNYIEDSDKLLFSSDWMEHFNNLEQLMPVIRQVPMQFGNDGNIGIVEPPQQVTNWQQQVQQNNPNIPHQYPNQNAQQPNQCMAPPNIQQNNAPALRKTNKGLDFKSIMQVNPAIGYNQNVLNPLIANQLNMQNPMMNRQSTPSWAIPPHMQQQFPQQFYNPNMQQQYPPQMNMQPQYPNMQPQYPNMQPQYPQQQFQPIKYY